MRKIFILIFIFLLCNGNPLQAQTDEAGRSFSYFSYNYITPREFRIKNIQVEEFTNRPLAQQKALVIIYSGLSIGQTIKVPGNEVPKAIENLWALGYFSDIQIYMKIVDEEEVVLNFVVKEQQKLTRYGFKGVTKSQAKNLKDEAGLKGGMYITPNLINRTKTKVLKYYFDKGYYSASVKIVRITDTIRNKKTNAIERTGEKFDIYITKGPKAKIKEFDFQNNEGITDKQLVRTFSKMLPKKGKWKLWISSKFIREKFDEEKQNLIAYYQSKGYRDARIISDSIEKVSNKRIVVHIKLFEGKKYYFRNITWKGNIKFRTTLLDTLVGIKKGDVFNSAKLQEKLFSNLAGVDVQSLYMDDGYLFFQMAPVETGVFNDSIDIEIRITEGPQARIGKVYWTGNTKTNDRVVLREIRTKPGDIFSKTQIQRTMQSLATVGLFDPQQLNVNPRPNPASGTVDIEYTLVEKPSDQIELSGGWGGNGFSGTPTLIGTAGVVLNNFSTRKLFSPKLWNPVPTGDGQKLSLRAQSNGSSYQGYTFSFTEPWLGGKKPNALGISVFHTVNSFDFRSRKDPLRQAFFNSGVNLSIGKRLKWPDDFFSLQTLLSLQQYKMQNLDGGIYSFPSGFSGKSYNISLQTTLARTSLSDPIYPMSGSSFTLSLQATPPYSLLNGKDVNAMSLSEKYRFAEFYKWKFDAEWHTTLYKKLVLTTKARFGFLGYYNPKLGTTFFERFQVGGAGIFGFNIAATEIISQRGYDNYLISQAAMNGQAGAPLFNKFTTELRYAIVQGQTATVYCLAFAEAGDAWSKVANYNPFQLKRAAGAGIRLFMPMFGLIGLDWAYGFDWKQVPNSGKPGQIHFFIGQQF